jgi:Beta-lactamase class C and other penicillin binding proteins
MTDLRSLVIDSSRRHGLGGVAVAVVATGEQPAIECLGLADRARDRPVTPDTVFRIASISKTLTAIRLMQLRDEGRFQLDDAVNNYLKGLRIESPPGAPEVTFRHLLTHTAGIGEVPRLSDLVRRDAWGAGPPNAAPLDPADLYAGAVRAEVAAGTKWAYANHGFVVLGKLIADVGCESFVEQMRQHVLLPLGMANTDSVRSERVSDRLAAGYHWILGRFGPVKDYDLNLLGAGSVLSSLSDMARYAAWLLDCGSGARGDLLAHDTLSEMTSPQFMLDPRLTTSMGLSFFLDRFGTHRVSGHDGNVPGFASALLVAPDDGVGVVVLTNTGSFIGAHRLAAAALRSRLRVPDPAGLLPRSDVPDSPHVWSELTGCYAPKPGFLTNARTWEMAGGEVEVCVRNRRLLLRALSPFRHLRRGVELHATDAADPFLFAFDIEGLVVSVAFGTDDAGRVERLCIGAPAMATLHRRPVWRSSRRRLRAGVASGVAVAAIKRARRDR